MKMLKTTIALLACLMLGNSAFGMGELRVGDVNEGSCGYALKKGFDNCSKWYNASALRMATGFGSGAVLGGLLGYYNAASRIKKEKAKISGFKKALDDIDKQIICMQNIEASDHVNINEVIRIVDGYLGLAHEMPEWELFKVEWKTYNEFISAHNDSILTGATLKRILQNAAKYITTLKQQTQNREFRCEKRSDVKYTTLGGMLVGSLLGGLGYYLAAIKLFNK